MDGEYAPRPARATRTLFDPSAVVGGAPGASRDQQHPQHPTQHPTHQYRDRDSRKYKSPRAAPAAHAPAAIVQRRVDSGPSGDSAAPVTTELQPRRIEHRAVPSSPAPPTAAILQQPQTTSASQHPQHHHTHVGSSSQTLKILAEPSTTASYSTMRVLPASAVPHAVLSDAPGSYIIGVLGRKGVGKSTIMNLFANPAAAPGPSSSTRGAPASFPFNTKTTTRGVDMHSTGDGLVLLDTQPLILSHTKKKRVVDTENTPAAVNLSERLALFMFSVCHVIIVVYSGSSLRDDELWAFLRKVEAEKCRLDGIPVPVDDFADYEVIIKGGKRRWRRKYKETKEMQQPADDFGNDSDKNQEDDEDDEDDADDDGNNGDLSDSHSDNEAEPDKRANAEPSTKRPPSAQEHMKTHAEKDVFFPSLVFVHNRAKPAEFATNNYAPAKHALSRAFRSSRLKISNNIIHLGKQFPAIYMSPAIPKNDDWPNLWMIPPFPKSAALESTDNQPTDSKGNKLTLLEKFSDLDFLKSHMRDNEALPARFSVLCDMLRDSVFELPRFPVELLRVHAGDKDAAKPGATVEQSRWFQMSEREWYKAAVERWNSQE
ncbi:smg-9, nonsense mediated mRNA decay factor [Entophlyctis sp. JEL0112]|nr:smg-9, nonsense mediated mRNA decay factor [Entophlyctis sp. JEL0112]